MRPEIPKLAGKKEMYVRSQLSFQIEVSMRSPRPAITGAKNT